MDKIILKPLVVGQLSLFSGNDDLIHRESLKDLISTILQANVSCIKFH